jgi:uncharacterized membrane protein HdeD (DUF308 family)
MSRPVKIVVGVILIIIGILALITPFTPGSWLAFVGLELLGIRVAFWEKIKDKFIKPKKDDKNISES